METDRNLINVVGGGLAGCEAAFQLAERGFKVNLYEMRPQKTTGAHITNQLAELVCSNSLGSNLPNRAAGLLKNELRMMKSLLMQIADEASLPSGAALAVDRNVFSEKVTNIISNHRHINLIRNEFKKISQQPTIICSGPLTSPTLAEEISNLSGKDNLFFFDAIAPIIMSDSINMEIAYRASRYEKGEDFSGDYINCPFNKQEYNLFIQELIRSERIPLKHFEEGIEHGVRAGAGSFFEGCLPIEILASRGESALAFGPLRPVGLWNPHTKSKPYAVLQLRQDNLAGNLYNMVGFQTNLTFREQKRLFQKIPGLENAEFARFGQMHRNTFIASPHLIHPTLQSRLRPNLFFAGQITGVEGYAGNIGTGLLAAINMSNYMNNKQMLTLPPTSMLGALIKYITQADMKDFQPMKANYGILPALGERIKTKNERYQKYSDRAIKDLRTYLLMNGEIVA